MSTQVNYTRKQLPNVFTKIGMPLLLIGLIGVAAGFMADSTRATYNMIVAFMFVASIGIGSIFLVGLEYIAGAVWSTPFRRLAEINGMFFIVSIVLAIPIWYFMHDIYHWTHLEAVANDPFLSSKQPYLNEMSFFIRTGLVFLIVSAFYFMFRSNSMKQDESGDQKYTKKNIWLSAPFMAVFGIGISILAIDYMMSLEPHWYSTIFGIYYFAGTFAASVALVTVLAINLHEKGRLVKGINRNHYYSLGGLMFAFSAFWMYIAFSQFMLIWYANIPEETLWFIPRLHGGWGVMSLILIIVKFVVPFGLLIQRQSKRDPKRLKFAAIWILCAHFYDLYWIVLPRNGAGHHEIAHAHGPTAHWMDLLFPVFVLGIIMVGFKMFANNKNLVAYNDPKMERAMDFHV